MRKELARSRSELEELRPERTQEKWRKQRAIERENRQLRERLLALQDAEGDLRRLRVELRDASQKGEEEKEVAARVQREQRQGRLSQAEALKTLRQQLASEQGELKELRQQLMSCEAHALRLSEGSEAAVAREAAAALAQRQFFEQQQGLDESRIQELCRSLMKAESQVAQLEGASTLQERHEELQGLQLALHRLHCEHQEAHSSSELRRSEAQAEAQASSELQRRLAELNGELHKERGRKEQLRRQLQSVTDERDEALARDWSHVEQARQLQELQGGLQAECERLRSGLRHEEDGRRALQMRAAQAEHMEAQHKDFGAELQEQRNSSRDLQLRVQELQQHKLQLEADRGKLWSELQQQFSSQGQLQQQEQLQQQRHKQLLTELQELQQHKDLLEADRSKLWSELQQQSSINGELQQKEQLHSQQEEKWSLEAQELQKQSQLVEELRSQLQSERLARNRLQEEVEGAESSRQQEELQALRTQCTQHAKAAGTAAVSRRNQCILHKQQLENMQEEYQEQLQALNKQHMQQLTVQQHMLDPERLSTFVDDLLDEISHLQKRLADAEGRRREVPKGAVPLEAASLRLAKMRQRLAANRGEELPTPARRPSERSRTPSAERTQRVWLEPPRLRSRSPSTERGRQQTSSCTRMIEPVVYRPYTLEPVARGAQEQDPQECQSGDASARTDETLLPEAEGFEVSPAPYTHPTPIQRRLQALSRMKQVHFEIDQ